MAGWAVSGRAAVAAGAFAICLTGTPAGWAVAAEYSEGDAVRHRQALTLFEEACLTRAPDFRETEAIFAALGLTRPAEAAAYRLDALEIYAGVVPVQAGQVAGRQCTVMLARGNLAILVLGVRTALDRYALKGSVTESPPTRADDPVLWAFRLPGIGAVSVTAGLGEAGIAVIGMQVAERGPRR
ncbi:MAG: hypothetical protein AAFR17_01520 [Pseudomonadota bacterium]